MTPTSRTVLALAAGMGLSSPAEELVYAPDEGSTLSRTFDAEASYDLDGIRVEIDGEEVPHGETPELTIDSDEHVAVTDRLLSVEDGHPLSLRRKFDELSRSVTYSSTEQDEDLEESSVCDLEGSTVHFEWNAEEGAYEASDEDDVLEQDVLDDLIEDMDLRQLLPDGEVDPGDEWDVDVDAYARLMWPGGFLHFYPEDGELDEKEMESDREMVANLEGEGTVKFEEVREEDGVSLAVLTVRIEVDSHATTATEGPGGSEAERTLEMSREIEGTLLWNIEDAHLHSAELEADADLDVSEAGTLENPQGEEVEFTQTRSFSGTISYTVTIERRD